MNTTRQRLSKLPMEIKRIVPDIPSSNLEASKHFYAGFLGMHLAMDMDWILTFVSSTTPQAQISILKSDEPHVAHADLAITIEVSDVDRLY
ncbi:MAG: hypothetical protein R3330_12925, partial [Saprospiraceae bacterium]|nr:hypothetical protein [Saprospiraceae bacterium]